jgi:hypothetical protein
MKEYMGEHSILMSNEIRSGAAIFPFPTVLIQILSPIKSPIHWVWGWALFLGIKQLKHKGNHSSPANVEVKNV